MSKKDYKKVIHFRMADCYEAEDAYELFKHTAKFMGIIPNDVYTGDGLKECSDCDGFWYYPHIQAKYMLERIEEFEKVITLAGVKYSKAIKYEKPYQWKH